MKGLSRMRGNSHVRFLGEGLAVMPSSYPILNGVDQMIMEPGVSGRVPFCSSGFQKARGGFTA